MRVLMDEYTKGTISQTYADMFGSPMDEDTLDLLGTEIHTVDDVYDANDDGRISLGERDAILVCVD